MSRSWLVFGAVGLAVAGQSVALDDSRLLIGANSVGDGAAYIFGQSDTVDDHTPG